MERREVLRLSGLSALGGLAGCQGLLREDTESTTSVTTTATPRVTTTDGPAQFRDVAIELPEDPTVGDPLRVGVAATNYGGEAGSFTDTLVLDGPNENEWPVEIPAVEPGYRGMVTFEPTWWLSGYYRFWLDNRDVENGIRVHPRSAKLGETLELDNGVRFTLNDVSFHSPIALFSEEEERGIVLPATNNGSQIILTIFHVSIENTSNPTYTVKPGRFQIPIQGTGNEIYFQAGDDHPEWPYDNLTNTRLNGRRIIGNTIQPGTSQSGLVLGQLDYEDAVGPISFGVQQDFALSPELLWIVPTNGNNRSLPRYEIVDISLPRKPTINSESEYQIHVKNIGDKTGTFNAILEYPRPDYSTRALKLLDARLDPEQTTIFSGIISFPFVRKYDIHLKPFGLLGNVVTQPYTQYYGEPYNFDNEFQIRIITPKRSREVQFGRDVDQYNVNAEPNRSFISVGVEATISNDDAVHLIPGFSEFAVPTGEGELARDIRVWAPNHGLAGINRRIKEHENRLEDPYEGQLWPENPADHIQTDRLRGFIPFYIPRELDEEDEIVQARFHKGEGQYVVSEWHHKLS